MILLVRIPIILLDILEIYYDADMSPTALPPSKQVQLSICRNMSNTSLPELYKRCLEKVSKLCDLPTIGEETQVKKQLFYSRTSTCTRLGLQLTP